MSSSEPSRSLPLKNRPEQRRGGRSWRSRLRLADVRPGEGKHVIGASVTLAGIVAAHVALETARDALFLAKLPPQDLSFVYLIMALLGFLVGRYDQTVARVLGRTSAVVLALMVAAVGTMLFYLVEQTKVATFWLYLWTGFIGTALTLQFWLFVGGRFTSAQGRRLYGLIAAGGVSGAVLGGALGALCTRLFRVESLLVVAASLHLLTALLVTAGPTARHVTERDKQPLDMKQALSLIKNSPYLLRVGGLIGCATVSVLLIDYLFKSVTATHVPSADLGPFLAQYYTALNAAALIVQLFIVMRVLQRAGTILALSLLPILIVVGGGVTVAFGGVLMVVLLTKGADGALRHSLHRVSTELLFLPLSSEERTSAKPLFDSVLSRGAQAIGAVVILGLTQFHIASPRVLGGCVVLTAVIWTGLALSLKGPYLDQFRRALGRPGGDNPIDASQLNLDGVEVVLEALSSPDENRVIAAMSLLEQAERTGLIPALVLYHPSPSVLDVALRTIPEKERKDWVPLAERLLTHQDKKVRLAAVRALGKAGYWETLSPASFSDPEVCATACFFLADRLPEPERHPDVAKILDQEKGADEGALTALVRTIAEFGDARWSSVLSQLSHAEIPELDRVLPKAMARTRDTRFLPVLIRRLAFRDGRGQVREALVALGEEGLDALSEALSDPRTDPAVLLHLPRAICRFQTKKARNILLDILESDLPGAVRFKALRGLGRLALTTKMRFPRSRVLPVVEENARESLRAGVIAAQLEVGLRQAPSAALPSGTLLVSLLGDKQRQSIERVTRLLSLLHKNEDLRSVYFALSSGESSAVSNAGELLEVLTLGYDEELREILRTLSDPTPLADRLEQVMDVLNVHVENEVDALREALIEGDLPLSALSAEYAMRREFFEIASLAEEVAARNTWLHPPVETSLNGEARL